MPRGKLTSKQLEIKKLLESGQTVEQVADLTDTTVPAIRAQVSRMRKAGHRIKDAPTRSAPAAVPTPSRSVSGTSVEEHITSELEAVDSRLQTIDATLHNLNAEHRELSERRERLKGAEAALAPDAAKPALAVVGA